MAQYESDHSTSSSHKHEGAGGDTLCTEDISAIAPTEATSVSSGEYHSAVEEEPTPVVQKTIVSSGLVTNTQIVLFNLLAFFSVMSCVPSYEIERTNYSVFVV